MTFIPSGDGAVIQVTPKQNVVTKSFPVKGAILPGEQVDLLSNGAVQGQTVIGSPSANFEAMPYYTSLFSGLSSNGFDTIFRVFDNQYVCVGRHTTANTVVIIPFTVSDFGVVTEGSNITYSSGTTINTAPSIAKIGTNQIVITISTDGSSSSRLALATVMNNAVTINDTKTFDSSRATRASHIVDISSDSFVVCYGIVPSSSQQYALVGSVSDNTITLGTPLEIRGFSGNVLKQGICKLDTNKVLLLTSGGASQVEMSVGTISGLVLTKNTVVNVTGSTFTHSAVVTQLGVDKAMFFSSASSRYIVNVTGTTPVATQDTTAAFDAYFTNNKINQQPLNNDKLVLMNTNNLTIGLWDFSSIPITLLKSYTFRADEGIDQSFQSIDYDLSSGFINVFGGRRFRTITQNALSPVIGGLEFSSSQIGVAGLTATRGYSIDSDNINLFSITEQMGIEGSIIDIEAHGITGLIKNIAKIDSDKVIISAVNSGIVNLKAVENVSDVSTVGALLSFGSGITDVLTDSELVVYTNASQLAMRGLSYSGLTISEGVQVQLEASVPSDFSVTKLDAGKYLVASDNQLHLVAVSAGVASITDSIVINASDAIDQVSLAGLTSTTACLAARSSTRGGGVYLYYITESAGSLTVNNERPFASVQSSLTKIAKITATSVAMAYQDGGDSDKNKVIVANLTGTQFFKAVALESFDTSLIATDIVYSSDNQVLYSDGSLIFNLTLDDDTFEIARAKIGTSKSDAFNNSNVLVDVFGLAIKSGYNNLEIGDSLLDADDTEWAYAVSDTEIVQL